MGIKRIERIEKLFFRRKKRNGPTGYHLPPPLSKNDGLDPSRSRSSIEWPAMGVPKKEREKFFS